MTALKALLVDLDGTLVDTNAANLAAYGAALSAYGLAIDQDWWTANAVGRHWSQFLPPLLAGHAGVDPGAVARRKAELYPDFLDRTVVNLALTEWIAASRPTLHAALVTTASRASAGAVLRFHALEDLFDEIVCGDDVTAPKPAPEAYAMAARRLCLAPGECLVIEDSPTGAAAARAFGAPCLLVRFQS